MLEPQADDRYMNDGQSLDRPVESLPIDRDRTVNEAMGLCLSGGGYRAMLYHAGAVWRLNELGLLQKIERISSVSGGSIAAGVLALHWSKLRFDANGAASNLDAEFVQPLRRMASRNVDYKVIGIGLLTPGSIGERLAGQYDKLLFDGATLQDLPDAPEFVINATNVQSGALWRFSKRKMADWRVGLVRNPDLRLALAVAASSAFPPVLSPLQIDLTAYEVETTGYAELTAMEYRDRVYLTDGGVYDNLGLETVWKDYATVFASDGGAPFAAEARPAVDWARHGVRIANIIDRQVRSLRKRQLIASYQGNPPARSGCYWGIATPYEKYKLGPAPEGLAGASERMSAVDTRLAALPDKTQEDLINWGYVSCDASIRRNYYKNPAPGPGFKLPYA